MRCSACPPRSITVRCLVTYTDPEFAHVGLTEEQARAAHGDDIAILRWPYRENDRAQTERETHGLVKAVTTKSGKILGAILGAQAGELIQVWRWRWPRLNIKALAGMISPYPTLGEINKRAAGSFTQLFAERTRRLVRFLSGSANAIIRLRPITEAVHMTTTVTRLFLGFLAGILSHLIFQGAFGVFSTPHIAAGPAMEPHAGAAPRRAEEPLARVLGRALGTGLRLARAAAHGAPRMVVGRARLRLSPAGRELVRRPAAEGSRRWWWLPSRDGADRVGFHAAFGIGVAIIFRLGLVLARRKVRASP